jgi:hypothetical protein
MLPHNHLVAVDFERQSRERLNKAAENSRLLQSEVEEVNGKQKESVWKPLLEFGWLKDLRLNPAS